MERLIGNGKKVFSYPLMGYWLDIGSPDDYDKAQLDIHNIKF
jgi:NDP-sugar pyrophosphorylase family protein